MESIHAATFEFASCLKRELRGWKTTVTPIIYDQTIKIESDNRGHLLVERIKQSTDQIDFLVNYKQINYMNYTPQHFAAAIILQYTKHLPRIVTVNECKEADKLSLEAHICHGYTIAGTTRSYWTLKQIFYYAQEKGYDPICYSTRSINRVGKPCIFYINIAMPQSFEAAAKEISSMILDTLKYDKRYNSTNGLIVNNKDYQI